MVYTVTEVSKMLDVSKASVRYWISKNKIDYIKNDGFIIMIPDEALRNFLIKHPKYKK